VAKVVTWAKKSKCGKYYIINGIKKWITAGMNADYFSTAVRTGKAGDGGLSFLLVDKNHPKTAEGISVKHIKTSDTKAAATAWVYFDDCYMPVENLMGKENGGFKLMMYNFKWASLPPPTASRTEQTGGGSTDLAGDGGIRAQVASGSGRRQAQPASSSHPPAGRSESHAKLPAWWICSSSSPDTTSRCRFFLLEFSLQSGS